MERDLKTLTDENLAYANEIVATTSPLIINKSVRGEAMTREEKAIAQKYYAALSLISRAKKRARMAS